MDTYKKLLVKDRNTGYYWYLSNVSDLNISYSNTITEYPTVSGVKVSDNMYKEPSTLSFSVSFNRFISNNFYYVDTDGKVNKPTLEEFKNIINNWNTNGVRLDIVTVEEILYNMVINSISVAETADTRGCYSPKVSLKEVREAGIKYLVANMKDDKILADNVEEIDYGTNTVESSVGKSYSDSFLTDLFNQQTTLEELFNMENVEEADNLIEKIQEYADVYAEGYTKYYTLNMSTSASHSFRISVNKNSYRIHIIYTADDKYVIDIDKVEEGNFVNIVSGLNITCGADLLYPFKKYNLGKLFVVPKDKRYFDLEPTSKTIVDKYLFIWGE